MAASLRLGNTSVYVDSEWTNIDITPVLPERKFVPKQIYSMAIKCWQQLQLSSSRRSGWLYIIGCSVLLSTASLTKNLVLQLVPLSSLSCSWITRDMDFTCPHDDMASHFLIEVLLSPLKLKASHPKRYFTYADIKGAHKESGLCICIMWHYIIWLLATPRYARSFRTWGISIYINFQKKYLFQNVSRFLVPVTVYIYLR